NEIADAPVEVLLTHRRGEARGKVTHVFRLEGGLGEGGAEPERGHVEVLVSVVEGERLVRAGHDLAERAPRSLACPRVTEPEALVIEDVERSVEHRRKGEGADRDQR